MTNSKPTTPLDSKGKERQKMLERYVVYPDVTPTIMKEYENAKHLNSKRAIKYNGIWYRKGDLARLEQP